MKFELSEFERELLMSLREGIAQILIYKLGPLYPSLVSLTSQCGKTVTLGVREEYVGYRFEVFPLRVTDNKLSSKPDQIMECSNVNSHCTVSILQKSEWDEPASDETKAVMLGNPDGATTLYEGRASDIPDCAINQATLQAGIEITGDDGGRVLIATSMFPYSLYVSGCDFSEAFDPDVYERIKLC